MSRDATPDDVLAGRARWCVVVGDCRRKLPALPEGVVHAVATDTPYGLTRASRGGSRRGPGTAHFRRLRLGTDGEAGAKSWDGSDVALKPAVWRQLVRTARPGAHLLAFGGARSWHRLAVAAEDGGWEPLTSLAWLYGTGMAKGRNLARDVEAKAPGEGAAWEGWSGDLRPGFEPIVLSRKRRAGSAARCLLEHGAGGLNLGACRPERADGESLPPNVIFSHEAGCDPDGLGCEPSCPARHLGGAESVSDDRGLPNAPAARFFYGAKAAPHERPALLDCGCGRRVVWAPEAALGCDDRDGALHCRLCGRPRSVLTHPTVKPQGIVAWCVRLILPRGGVLLDPFAGTGTFGAEALALGGRVILVEGNVDYAELAVFRMECADGSRGVGRPIEAPSRADSGPLFRGAT